MATYYTIHCYDQESTRHADADLIDNCTLYSTFEKARRAIEEEILLFIEEYNAKRDATTDKEEVFEKPNISSLRSYEKYCHYYEMQNGYIFTIRRMTVEE